MANFHTRIYQPNPSESTSLLASAPNDHSFNRGYERVWGSKYEWKVFITPFGEEKLGRSKETDWVLFGYWLFEAGSICYFFQAILPYGGLPELLDAYHLDDLGSWFGLIAGAIFVIESFIYLYGWKIGRDAQISVAPFFKDWNFWGNILFIIGSVGYQFTSISQMTNTFTTEALYINLWLAVLFVFDSVFYLLALLEGEHSRAPRLKGTEYSLQSDVDFYLQGTLFFIFGSFVYLWAAYVDLTGGDSSFLYVVGACVFLIDAPLYILSGHQVRDDEKEISIFQRKNIFLIETRISFNTYTAKI